MSTKNLSNYDINSVPSGKDMSFAIIVSEWNNDITEKLYNGAYNTLVKHGVKKENIHKEYVPGTFELTYAANIFANYAYFDAVIVLGCVIQGETRHFDFICSGVTHGISEINATLETPVIFGVLTTNNKQQAIDRAGGKLGNKGDEAAVTALKMSEFRKRTDSLITEQEGQDFRDTLNYL